MALDLATLSVRVENGQIVATTGALDKLTGAGAKAESTFDRLKGAAAGLGVALGAGAIFAKFVRETIESQNAMAQLEARVKSTGMAAGFTVGQLDDMSVAMQRQTAYGDEAVKGAQAMLLTFGKIKGDQFAGATEAVANLATALGGDLQGAAIQVGKALQDPAQGLLALRRSGVSFSEAQQDVIKALFETGREAEAQRMILAELQKEFGGAAEAARNTFGGALKALNASMGDLFELTKDDTSGIVALINATNESVRELNEMKGAIKGVAYTLGAAGLAGGLAAGVTAIGAMVGGVATLSDAFIATRLVAQAFWIAVTGPVGLAIAGITTVALVMAKILGDDAKANAAMAAREEADKYMAQMALKRHRDKMTAEQELALVKQAAALADDKAAKDKAKADAAEIAGLMAKTVRARELAAAQEAVNRVLDARADAARGLTPFGQAGIDAPLSTSKTGISGGPDPVAQGTKEIDDFIRVQQAKDRIADEYAEKSAKTREQIEQNFLRGMQDAFAKTFENIFTKGIKSFGDLFKGLGDLIKQAAAQWAASGLMNFLTSNYTKGKGTQTGADGVAGGVGAVAGAIPVVGWIAAAAAAVFALSANAKTAAEAVRAASAAFSETVYRLRVDVGELAGVEQNVANASAQYAAARRQLEDKTQKEIDAVNAQASTTRWHKEKRAAEIHAAAAKELEKLNVLEAKRVAQLQEENAAAARAAEVARKYTEERGLDDMKVRQLALDGKKDEAEQQRLWNEQVAAFKQAVDAGWSMDALAALGALQTAERERLHQTQEAAKAAHDAAAAEAALAKAMQQTQATQDIEVELMRAKGQTAEADARELDLAQQRRLEDAQKNQTEDYVKKLLELQALERANRAAAGAAGAGAGSEASSTASNIFAGADTVTTNFSSKVSAEVGDRMLDNLVSMRVILRAIEVNTRNIGGRLNTSLGLSLADNRTLMGSAVLS